MIKYVFFLILLFYQAAYSQAVDPYKNVYKKEAWKERDAWQRPEDLIGLLKIKPGSVVADVGCGEGYFTFKLAAKVGPQGKVFAVDNRITIVKMLEFDVKEKKLSQIKAIAGSGDDPKLPTDSLDAVIILDAYHEMKNPNLMLAHIFKALKQGGRLVMCEPIADERKGKPRLKQTEKHEINMYYALDDLKQAGFTIAFQQDPYIDRENIKADKMWVIVALK